MRPLEGNALGRLGLAGAGLARDDDGLRLLHHLHVAEGLVRDGEHVRRHGAQGSALFEGTRITSSSSLMTQINPSYLVGFDGGPGVEVLDDGVGVDGDEDVGDVGVDLVLEVALPDVVEERGLVEVHEAAVVVHRLRVIILGGVQAVETANGMSVNVSTLKGSCHKLVLAS